ncbi:TPA: hypothetical protein N0F65_011331 [Lagenidium giganteum]|uniref:HECT-type E3 ubiquitin transferase n=1 Tax=Lagenidium giganteum TaxID=4803 RepID=A0AAV2YNA7_9STRA|nr:TPA: hypothetical protein N0F65_011331 [Lagenidium giganteum]
MVANAGDGLRAWQVVAVMLQGLTVAMAAADATSEREARLGYRRLATASEGYNFMFYFVIGAMMLTCLIYNIFFKHKMEASFLRQHALPETMLRQDVIASDQEMNRLWECEVCCFKSYDAQQNCMLCGADRSFKLMDKRGYDDTSDSGVTSTTASSSSKYMLYVDATPKSTTASTVSSASSTSSKINREFFKRRLSALTLRQQSARRRHEWFRHRDDEGNLVWKRKKNYLDRKALKNLRSMSSSSLRESVCSTDSSNSVGIVSRIVVSPKNPTGRIELDAPEGSSALRGSESSGRFTQEELEQVSELPFQQKHAWFVQHTAAMEVPWEYGHLLLEIERDNLLHNSCEQLLWASPEQLHQSLRIKFANEPGVDAGGLVREWFTLMTKEVFDDTTGLFYTNGNNDGLMINPASAEASVDHLMYYQAIGRFIGRGLFEGTLIDCHLALPICKHILGIPMTFSDLEFVDNDLYKNLKWLKENNGVESLALDFTANVDQFSDKTKIVELIPDGANIAVTDENKKEYIDLRFKWIMATSISQQLASLVQGIFAVIPKELLSVFDHQELELLICGIPEIDLVDWKNHTIYVGERDDKVINWFWKIVEEFSNEQKARLLQFTTGSARVPVQGFKALTMNDGRICPFAIQCVHKDECLYPRAHTCFNRIDLPRYDSEKDMRIALSLVIQMEVTGFTIDARSVKDAHTQTQTSSERPTPLTPPLMVDFELIVLLQFVAVGLYCVWGIVRQCRLNRRINEMMLHTPLLPEYAHCTASIDHRLDAATSEAAEGFNACRMCAFENFKRLEHCIACGTEIDPQVVQKTLKSTRGRPTADTGTTYDRLTAQDNLMDLSSLTNRQRRARRRREWRRQLDEESGRLMWRRYGGSTDESAKAREVRPFLVRFNIPNNSDHQSQVESTHADEEPVSEEDCIEIIVDFDLCDDTPEGNGETGTSEDEGYHPAQIATGLPLAEMKEIIDLSHTFVDPQVEPMCEFALESGASQLHGEGDNLERRGEIVEMASHDFPRKYVHFVVTTAGLMVPAEQEQAKLNISRKFVYEHSMEMLVCIPQKNAARTVFRINFSGETGIDAGGVQREWFMLINDVVTARDLGVLTCVNKTEQCYYLNRNSSRDIGDDHLEHFHGLGRLIGRALLEGLVLGFHISLPLLKLILGQPLTLEDLKFHDADAYQGLVWLLEHDGAEDLCLTFTVTEVDRAGNVRNVPLVPNGECIDVTDANKVQFVERKLQYLLVDSVAQQLYVFLKGVYDVIPQSLLMLFDYEELDFLLCGVDEIDVDDWEAHSRFIGDLQTHPVRKWFWELVREMPNEYRRRLLHFATGSSRVPLGGFKALTSYDGRLSPFTLKGLETKHGYIRSHACFNRLDLPTYRSQKELRKVLYAILETEMYGFTTE